MKKRSIALIQMSFFVALFLSTKTFAQPNDDSIILKQLPVTLENNKHESYQGYLQSATDSIISISSVRPSMQRISNPGQVVTNYNFKAIDIHLITVPRKNKKLLGALIGLGVGTLAGIMLSPKDRKTTPSSNTNVLEAIVNQFGDGINYAAKILVTVVECGLGGTALGAIVAPGSYKTILINGRHENLRDFINTHKNY